MPTYDPDNLWPVPVNWRDPVEVTRSYKTDITNARTSREQRRALRNEPRRSFSFTVSAARANFRRLTRTLQTWQNAPTTLGDPTRSAMPTAAIASASATLIVQSVPTWLSGGINVVLETGDQAEVRGIVSVTGTTVTFAAGTAYDWPVETSIRPALYGLIGLTVNASQATNAVAEAKFSFNIEPGIETAPVREPHMFVLDGREVFIVEPNWAEDVSADYTWPVEQVDFGRGRIRSYRRVPFSTAIRKASFIGRTTAELSEIENFFDRQYGRRGEFHMSTGTEDMVPVTPLTDGEDTLLVSGSDIYDGYLGDPVYKAIAVHLFDGRVLYRTVLTMALVGGNTEIQVSSPWLCDAALGQIGMVAWLPVVRFGSDDMTTEWLTNDIGQVQISVQTLENLTAEGNIMVYDGAAQWELENWGEAGLLPLDMLDHLVNIRYPEITL